MPSLLDLPPELIDNIAELVYAVDPKQYLGTVHRAFLPISRRLFFRDTAIKMDRVARLSDLLHVHEDLASCVKFLALLPSASPARDISLRSLLAVLPGLTVLWVATETALKEVFSPLPGSLASLSALIVVPSDNPADPSTVLRIPPYPNLRKFTIALSLSAPLPLISRLPPASVEDLTPSAVEHLHLFGDLASVAACLIAQCPHLEALTLAPSTNTSLAPLLAAIIAPQNLRVLELRHTVVVDDLSATFTSLVGLKELSFEAAHLSPPFCATLRHLPSLSSIHLGSSPSASLADILPLVQLHTSPLSLARLSLDDPKPERRRLDTSPLPPPRLSKDGVAVLLTAAEQVGLELSGYCVKVVKAEQAERAKRAARAARRGAQR
ncbi:hypothetical protein JCM10213_002314 [Rhodosporidiobolus nylandii]